MKEPKMPKMSSKKSSGKSFALDKISDAKKATAKLLAKKEKMSLRSKVKASKSKKSKKPKKPKKAKKPKKPKKAKKPKKPSKKSSRKSKLRSKIAMLKKRTSRKSKSKSCRKAMEEGSP